MSENLKSENANKNENTPCLYTVKYLDLRFLTLEDTSLDAKQYLSLLEILGHF